MSYRIYIFIYIDLQKEISKPNKRIETSYFLISAFSHLQFFEHTYSGNRVGKIDSIFFSYKENKEITVEIFYPVLKHGVQKKPSSGLKDMVEIYHRHLEKYG